VTCLILDDEPLAIEVLREYVSKVSDLDCVGEFRNPLDALAFLRDHDVDLVFLDVNMPGLTGLQFLASLARRPRVIFTTAYSSHAAQSYELDAIDYLTKPIELDRFLRAVDKARLQLRAADRAPDAGRDTVFVKSGTSLVKIDLGEVCLVQAAGNYVAFVVGDRHILSLMTFSDAAAALPASRFVRVHKSFIVNLDHVDVVKDETVRVAGRRIRVGPLYRDELRRRLEARRLAPPSSNPTGA